MINTDFFVKLRASFALDQIMPKFEALIALIKPLHPCPEDAALHALLTDWKSKFSLCDIFETACSLKHDDLSFFIIKHLLKEIERTPNLLAPFGNSPLSAWHMALKSKASFSPVEFKKTLVAHFITITNEDIDEASKDSLLQGTQVLRHYGLHTLPRFALIQQRNLDLMPEHIERTLALQIMTRCLEGPEFEQSVVRCQQFMAKNGLKLTSSLCKMVILNQPSEVNKQYLTLLRELFAREISPDAVISFFKKEDLPLLLTTLDAAHPRMPEITMHIKKHIRVLIKCERLLNQTMLDTALRFKHEAFAILLLDEGVQVTPESYLYACSFASRAFQNKLLAYAAHRLEFLFESILTPTTFQLFSPHIQSSPHYLMMRFVSDKEALFKTFQAHFLHFVQSQTLVDFGNILNHTPSLAVLQITALLYESLPEENPYFKLLETILTIRFENYLQLAKESNDPHLIECVLNFPGCPYHEDSLFEFFEYHCRHGNLQRTQDILYINSSFWRNKLFSNHQHPLDYVLVHMEGDARLGFLCELLSTEVPIPESLALKILQVFIDSSPLIVQSGFWSALDMIHRQHPVLHDSCVALLQGLYFDERYHHIWTLLAIYIPIPPEASNIHINVDSQHVYKIQCLLKTSQFDAAAAYLSLHGVPEVMHVYDFCMLCTTNIDKIIFEQLLSRLDALFKEKPEDINQKYGRQSLLSSIIQLNPPIEFIRFLLKYPQLDIDNHWLTASEQTPLEFACYLGRKDIALLLLEGFSQRGLLESREFQVFSATSHQNHSYCPLYLKILYTEALTHPSFEKIHALINNQVVKLFEIIVANPSIELDEFFILQFKCMALKTNVPLPTHLKLERPAQSIMHHADPDLILAFDERSSAGFTKEELMGYLSDTLLEQKVPFELLLWAFKQFYGEEAAHAQLQEALQPLTEPCLKRLNDLTLLPQTLKNEKSLKQGLTLVHQLIHSKLLCPSALEAFPLLQKAHQNDSSRVPGLKSTFEIRPDRFVHLEKLSVLFDEHIHQHRDATDDIERALSSLAGRPIRPRVMGDLMIHLSFTHPYSLPLKEIFTLLKRHVILDDLYQVDDEDPEKNTTVFDVCCHHDVFARHLIEIHYDLVKELPYTAYLESWGKFTHIFSYHNHSPLLLLIDELQKSHTKKALQLMVLSLLGAPTNMSRREGIKPKEASELLALFLKLDFLSIHQDVWGDFLVPRAGNQLLSAWSALSFDLTECLQKQLTPSLLTAISRHSISDLDTLEPERVLPLLSLHADLIETLLPQYIESLFTTHQWTHSSSLAYVEQCVALNHHTMATCFSKFALRHLNNMEPPCIQDVLNAHALRSPISRTLFNKALMTTSALFSLTESEINLLAKGLSEHAFSLKFKEGAYIQTLITLIQKQKLALFGTLCTEKALDELLSATPEARSLLITTVCRHHDMVAVHALRPKLAYFTSTQQTALLAIESQWSRAFNSMVTSKPSHQRTTPKPTLISPSKQRLSLNVKSVSEEPSTPVRSNRSAWVLARKKERYHQRRELKLKVIREVAHDVVSAVMSEYDLDKIVVERQQREERAKLLRDTTIRHSASFFVNSVFNQVMKKNVADSVQPATEPILEVPTPFLLDFMKGSHVPFLPHDPLERHFACGHARWLSSGLWEVQLLDMLDAPDFIWTGGHLPPFLLNAPPPFNPHLIFPVIVHFFMIGHKRVDLSQVLLTLPYSIPGHSAVYESHFCVGQAFSAPIAFSRTFIDAAGCIQKKPLMPFLLEGLISAHPISPCHQHF